MKPFAAALKDHAKTALSKMNRMLEWSGMQIVPVSHTCEFRAAFQRIKELGIEPATVFDIGVGYGTPDMYSEFKSAKYFLIDPVPQALPYMEKWSKTLNATAHNIALSETDGELELGVPEDIRGTTIYKQVEQIGSLKNVLVPMKRFDSIFRPTDLISPCLVKIDVQGAELSVLKGMGSLMSCVDIFVIEVSSIVTLDGGAAHMFAVIDYMQQNGFTVYDICDLCRRPLDNALAQLDLMFCRKTSKLLEDRRWGHA